MVGLVGGQSTYQREGGQINGGQACGVGEFRETLIERQVVKSGDA
jgi:hypothetical protein